MEYFDVLDENGAKTGVKKLRTEVHRDGDWHRTVHVWIINSRGELLVQKRSPNKDSHPNMWDISSAGHIVAGDDSIATARKELKEELGITVKNEELRFLFSYKKQVILNGGTFINNEFNDVYIVYQEKDLSKFTIQQEEVSEIKYIHYEELERVLRTDSTFVAHLEEYERLFAFLYSKYRPGATLI